STVQVLTKGIRTSFVDPRLVPSCFAIFDLEPLSLSFDFVFTSEISKSLSFSLDRLCLLAILCLDQHAHTLYHLESLLTISLDRLDILKEDLLVYEYVVMNPTSAGTRHLHLHLYMNPVIRYIQRISLTGFPAQSVGSSNIDVLDLPCLLVLITGMSQSRQHGLIPNQVHATNYVLPTDKDLELLFQPMFDEYFEVTRVEEPVPSATTVNAHVVPPGTPLSTTFAQDAPSTSFSPSSFGIQPLVIQHDVVVGPTIEDTPITQATLHPSNNTVTGEPGSAQSSSGDVSIAEPNQVTQLSDHLRKWSKDHPLDNIVGNPSRPVSTRFIETK
ncbi:hypothetical protein Tco_0754595, partial [Tanacetum coccineum]